MTALTEKTETFFGTCKLPLSDRGIVLRYALRIYQDYVGKTPTSKHADGKFVDLLHGDAAFAMMGQQPLELDLEDGRRARVLVTDFQGHFVVNGPVA